MSDSYTVTLTCKEMQVIKTALNFALTNPYNSLDVERTIYSARDKMADTLKNANPDIDKHLYIHENLL
ncbi:MAG: hypothetical protein IKW19_08910 [Akkermansia sp.]|nr:hypothetical protein [Akkermansia sp.]